MATKNGSNEEKRLMRISDIVPLANQQPPIFNAEKVQGIELVLIDFEFLEGEQGDYYLLTCKKFDNGEDILINSGAKPVMKTLEIISQDKSVLPLQFHFKQSGRTWLME